jgi:hypothetical protein
VETGSYQGFGWSSTLMSNLTLRASTLVTATLTTWV